ncbi:MAG: sigma-70 family RNA polymerase sigma factor [Chloroflexi bacterium]|nr:MAG: sigma-70 family RNA polymerase sigma factor [Chloroflexota bacterium]TMD84110.1 MAG: sigma-70 family RNA polymerase sigma factor [Chloroflexota bacterium]
MDQDERLLVERAKSDAQAFGVLYDRYVEDIYRFAHARLGNVAAAEDVTADVFVKALRGISRYRDRGRPFSCWLYRIARNALADHFRHDPVNRELSDWLPDAGTQVEATAIHHLEVEDLWRLVEKLPPQQRIAMTLRFRDDRSAREAAAVMGKSEAAVKLLIYRAVGRLRSQVAVPDGAPGRSALAVS